MALCFCWPSLWTLRLFQVSQLLKLETRAGAVLRAAYGKTEAPFVARFFRPELCKFRSMSHPWRFLWSWHFWSFPNPTVSAKQNWDPMAMEIHSNFTYKSQHVENGSNGVGFRRHLPRWNQWRCRGSLAGPVVDVRDWRCVMEVAIPSIKYCENQLDMIRYIYIYICIYT